MEGRTCGFSIANWEGEVAREGVVGGVFLVGESGSDSGSGSGVSSLGFLSKVNPERREGFCERVRGVVKKREDRGAVGGSSLGSRVDRGGVDGGFEVSSEVGVKKVGSGEERCGVVCFRFMVDGEIAVQGCTAGD